MVEKIYDFHSHILPGMDDGCKDVRESVTALEMSYAQGVRGVCLTPHFYADESIEEFLFRRHMAEESLAMAIKEESGPFPQLCVGAEVAYYPNMSRTEEIEKLCLGDSRYLLLELPFGKWGSEVVRDLQGLCTRGITPILAHIDRYWSMQSREMFRKLLSMDLRVQINGAALLDWKRRGKAKKWLWDGSAQYVGSDCHNLTNRTPNLGNAFQKLPEETAKTLSAQGAQTWKEIAGG